MSHTRPQSSTDTREWLETDGLGGFASGTVDGVRTRRYHGLLLVAAQPAGRYMLVNGFDAWVEAGDQRLALSSHRYVPDVIHPDGRSRIGAFARDPWPTWTYAIGDRAQIRQEIMVLPGHAGTVITWSLSGDAPDPVGLTVRPLLSGRDYHALHRENSSFRFEPEVGGDRVTWRPYPGVPAVHSTSNGAYRHDPAWYRNFEYAQEAARGLDALEDLASPGELSWTLSAGERAIWVLSSEPDAPRHVPTGRVAGIINTASRTELRRRAALGSSLDRAADAYIVRRGGGRTIIAGYPWFTDWGRDTFIAMRGLTLATGRLAEARDILLEWSDAIVDGMLPNRFADAGGEPEFNAVDASLWFIIAVHELEAAVGARPRVLPAPARGRLFDAVERILLAYSAGTRFGIRADDDGLLAAGAPGVQLTWMDAKVGDVVFTPRSGKPVEVNALWLNALRIAGQRTPRWLTAYEQGGAAFERRFWNEAAGALYDVVDVDHHAGAVDASIRPNQIFAVGGLPFPVVSSDRARQIVDVVEQQLLTPMGLRTLAPGSAGYAPRYEGGVWSRDSAYHQGTVWPWLLGPFVEAWLRVHGNTKTTRATARRRFLDPLQAHLDDAGLGHISEITDAEAPFTPRGCAFQAWSLGEFLRLERQVLAAEPRSETDGLLI